MRRSLRTILSASRSLERECSHIVTTRQPAFLRSRPCLASRARLDPTLVLQNAAWLEGAT